MSKQPFRPGHFLVLLALSLSSEAYICAVYHETALPDGRIDIAKKTETVGLITGCDFCVSFISGNFIKFGCVRKGQSNPAVHDDYSSPCASLKDNFGCGEQGCCCRGSNCYDRLRLAMSVGLRGDYQAASRQNRGVTCDVFLLEKMGQDDVNAAMAHEDPLPAAALVVDEEGHIESVLRGGNHGQQISFGGGRNENRNRLKLDVETSYVRTSCSVCHLQFVGNILRGICVEFGQTDRICGEAKNLIGGHLACTSDSQKCCCKGADCTQEFYRLVTNQTLELSLISQPYSSTNSVVVGVRLMALITLRAILF